MAATYGWTARYVERELTDELLILYMDAAIDRLSAHAASQFAADVEAVRVGTIFVHEPKQHRRWRSDVDRRVGRSRETTTLEELAKAYPDHVIH